MHSIRDIKQFRTLIQFDVHVKFGIYQGEGGQWILRLDDFAEFEVPKDVDERCKAIPDYNQIDSVGQFQLMLKLMLEKAAGEWQQ